MTNGAAIVGLEPCTKFKSGAALAAALFLCFLLFVFNPETTEKRRGGTNGTPNRSSRAADSHTTKRRNGGASGAGLFDGTKRHTQELRGAARFGRGERDGAARFTMAHNYHFVIRAAHGWRIVHPIGATKLKITFLRHWSRPTDHDLTRYLMPILTSG